jgi:PhnB protein
MTVKPIPDGYHTVTPYLVVRDPASLIEFLRQVFNATEIERTELPDGRIMHAEVRIGDSVVMMGGANEDYPPMPAMLHLYLDDTDAVYQRSLEAGATSLREPEDQFYGDRTAGFQDEFGNQWWLATRIEDLSSEEIQRRAEVQARQG